MCFQYFHGGNKTMCFISVYGPGVRLRKVLSVGDLPHVCILPFKSTHASKKTLWGGPPWPSLTQVEHPVFARGKTQSLRVVQPSEQFLLVLPLLATCFSNPYSGEVSVACFPYPHSGEVSVTCLLYPHSGEVPEGVRTECQTTVV